jgi:hypothetical protein
MGMHLQQQGDDDIPANQRVSNLYLRESTWSSIAEEVRCGVGGAIARDGPAQYSLNED